MEYDIYSHRNALTILENEQEFNSSWKEVKQIISKITDEMIIECFETSYSEKNKSLSTSINSLLKEEFARLDWVAESPIFQDSNYDNERSDYWRLDFAKENISVEVAFNHSTVIAWNLLKPVLASELNHVQKAIQTKIGIIICATQEMKSAGNFDSAIGTYEKFVKHLPPLMNQLSVPMVIIGLKAPKSFKIKEIVVEGRKRGKVELI